ncbi:radical SAM protein [Desulfonatronovibrio hydrogenovorans]|uniref:radical SAM protein n=1 Tax=Desulfonatronovibrio hydrogenovorans TaxID=53245 RepID=UPI00048F50A3|nr:radical SAM protein [Desulfonatronovibrio hydrogenovorans]
MKLLNKLLGRACPHLDWIQVGVTSRCNASCVYCPHHGLKKSWKGQDMPLKVFQGLSTSFSSIGLVYLQGWGEPLLHPDFFQMLDLVKKKGARVGLTSNATLLDLDTIKKLTDHGLDVICLSVAGSQEEANNRIRPGTSLKKVITAIENLHKVRISRGGSGPQIHLAYMLLRSGLGELEAMPGFFNSLGLDEIVVSSLTLALSPEMEKEMYLAGSKPEFAVLKSELRDMKRAADEPERIFFHLFNPYLDGSACSENIHKACYMSVDGTIRPCVYTDFAGLAPHGHFKFLNGNRHPLATLEFGSIGQKDLGRIWTGQEYQEFRQRFEQGSLVEPCLNCTKRFIDDLGGPQAKNKS